MRSRQTALPLDRTHRRQSNARRSWAVLGEGGCAGGCRAADRTGTRGVDTHRSRPVEPGDRRRDVRGRDDGEDARRSCLHEAGRPRSNSGSNRCRRRVARRTYENDSITVLGHLGSGAAHSAFFAFDVDSGTVVAVMMNSNNPGPQAVMARVRRTGHAARPRRCAAIRQRSNRKDRRVGAVDLLCAYDWVTFDGVVRSVVAVSAHGNVTVGNRSQGGDVQREHISGGPIGPATDGARHMRSTET